MEDERLAFKSGKIYESKQDSDNSITFIKSESYQDHLISMNGSNWLQYFTEYIEADWKEYKNLIEGAHYTINDAGDYEYLGCYTDNFGRLILQFFPHINERKFAVYGRTVCKTNPNMIVGAIGFLAKDYLSYASRIKLIEPEIKQSKKRTLLVNLYGGPGTGKSTMMANLFARLKWQNIICEMAPEIAKDYVWAGDTARLQNQRPLFIKTLRKLQTLDGKVDVIITDSPLLNQILYDESGDADFHKQVIAAHESFTDRIDIFLERKKEFRQEGRLQSKDEAILLDSAILSLIRGTSTPYFYYKGEEGSVDLIINLIKFQLREINDQ